MAAAVIGCPADAAGAANTTSAATLKAPDAQEWAEVAPSLLGDFGGGAAAAPVSSPPSLLEQVSEATAPDADDDSEPPSGDEATMATSTADAKLGAALANMLAAEDAPAAAPEAAPAPAAAAAAPAADAKAKAAPKKADVAKKTAAAATKSAAVKKMDKKGAQKRGELGGPQKKLAEKRAECEKLKKVEEAASPTSRAKIAVKLTKKMQGVEDLEGLIAAQDAEKAAYEAAATAASIEPENDDLQEDMKRRRLVVKALAKQACGGKAWTEERRAKQQKTTEEEADKQGRKDLSKSDRDRYEAQLKLYRQIITVYKSAGHADPVPDPVQQEVQSLLTQLHLLGEPPTEVQESFEAGDAELLAEANAPPPLPAPRRGDDDGFASLGSVNATMHPGSNSEAAGTAVAPGDDPNLLTIPLQAQLLQKSVPQPAETEPVRQ